MTQRCVILIYLITNAVVAVVSTAIKSLVDMFGNTYNIEGLL